MTTHISPSKCINRIDGGYREQEINHTESKRSAESSLRAEP